MRRKLMPGQQLRIDTGCLVAYTKGISFDIQLAADIKSGLFGGEGIFLGTLSGEGDVWLQSLPFSRMANKVYEAAGGGQGETKGATAGLSDLSGLANIFGNS